MKDFKLIILALTLAAASAQRKTRPRQSAVVSMKDDWKKIFAQH